MLAPIVLANDAYGGEVKRVMLSIIIPVFNTAPYVENTLRSLGAEHAGKHEIIIVNDGSTDYSLELVCRWARNSKNPVIVVDKKNAGLSAARNTGLGHARGEYVAFLDSDDYVAPGIYSEMTILAHQERCDLVLCRSAVVDGATQGVSPFYDAWLWDLLIGSQRFRTTALRAEPRLLRLEPNANTRVTRRKFIDDLQLFYEPGLIFEDLCPHVTGIINANKIGLYNRTGYFYRVNRPGKITDERSERRLDMIKSASLTLQQAIRLGIDDVAAAHLLNMIARMLFWCGTQTLLGDRLRYFKLACELFQTVPSIWIRAHRRIFPAVDERVIILCLVNGYVNGLVKRSSGSEFGFWDMLRLSRSRHDKVARRRIVQFLVSGKKPTSHHRH